MLGIPYIALFNGYTGLGLHFTAFLHGFMQYLHAHTGVSDVPHPVSPQLVAVCLLLDTGDDIILNRADRRCRDLIHEDDNPKDFAVLLEVRRYLLQILSSMAMSMVYVGKMRVGMCQRFMTMPMAMLYARAHW